MSTELRPDVASFSTFGGLKLSGPPDAIGGGEAIVALDVDWDVSPEAIRPRMGTSVFKAAGKVVDGLFAHDDSRLIARIEDGAATRKLVAYGTAGEVLHESGAEEALKGAPMRAARFGSPTAANTYIGMGEAGTRKFDGNEFTKPTCKVNGEEGKAMPLAYGYLSWPEGGNRLVALGTTAAGGPGGAASSRSHVWFSDAGDAESWHTVAPEANFSQLSPGNGEDILDGCVWSGQIFVFKETQMFVFYGVSADAEGAPIFNFRVVDLGTTVLAPSSPFGSDPVCVAADDAVYFRAIDGIWATTGDEPGLVSDDLSALADSTGSSSSYFEDALEEEEVTVGRFRDQPRLAYLDRRLYVPSASMSYVYDIRRDAWLAWQSAAVAMTPWRASTSPSDPKHLYLAAGDSIYKLDPEATEDPSLVGAAGTTGELDPIWQSGFYAAGLDEATFTRMKLWGSGTVDIAVAEDFGLVAAAKTVNLGDSSSTRQVQLGQTATLFSHRFSGKGPWAIQRISRYLRETRVPATEKPS